MVVAPGETSETDADRVSGFGLYVYGVVRAGSLGDFDEAGIGDADVTLVERHGLAALVSQVQTAEVRLKRRDLHRHLHVIESAFARTTILPCPFGTVVASEQELEEGLLGTGRSALLAGLERLDGNVQLNVKASYDEDAVLRELVASDPEIGRLREQTRDAGDERYAERLQLGELVAKRLADRSARDADRLLSRLGEEALDVVVEEAPAGGVLKASFLVARDSLQRFDSVLERLSRDEHPYIGFELIGPLPPTAFAAASVGPEV